MRSARIRVFAMRHMIGIISALVGHSLGGYTVLGVGGGWAHWKDPRVKAILALSPYAAPFINKETLVASMLR